MRENMDQKNSEYADTFHVAHLYGSDYQEFKFHQCCDGVNDTFVVFILLRRKIIEFNEEFT